MGLKARGSWLFCPSVETDGKKDAWSLNGTGVKVFQLFGGWFPGLEVFLFYICALRADTRTATQPHSLRSGGRDRRYDVG